MKKINQVYYYQAVLSIWAVLFFCGSNCRSQSNEVVLDVPELYRSYLTNLGVVSFDYELAIYDKANNFSDKSTGSLRYDGVNLHKFIHVFGQGLEEHTLIRTLERLICPKSTFLEILVEGESEANVTGYLNIPPDINAARDFGEFSTVFGWTHLDADLCFIPDMLKTLKAVSVKRNERNEWVFRGKNDIFEIELRLDPAFHNALCYFSYKRIGIDTGPQFNDSYQFEVDSFSSIGQISFPDKFTTYVTRKGGPFTIEGRSFVSPDAQTQRVVRLKNISKDTSPIDERSIKSNIPNGSPALARDAPQIQHIWLDGKIVPKTDEVMLAIAQGGHKFMPGPDEPRFWMMGIGIALILFACGKKTYDYFKNKK